MADYLISLRHGLEAADRTAKEKKEISDIFKELNQQLNTGTQGRLAIGIHEFRGSGEKKSTASAALGSAVLGFLDLATHTGLGLSHKLERLPVAKLAVWRQETAGYPCDVIFGSAKYSCGDRAALERALKILLADPSVGAKVHEYMSHPLSGSPNSPTNPGKIGIKKALVARPPSVSAKTSPRAATTVSGVGVAKAAAGTKVRRASVTKMNEGVKAVAQGKAVSKSPVSKTKVVAAKQRATATAKKK